MLNLGFLVFPNFNILDLSGPLAAFDVPRREISPTPYRLTAYSENGGPVVSACGISVNTVALRRAEIDTFVAVGGLGAVAASRSPSMISLVRKVGDQIYVRDGRIWTSGGVTAGIDLALALIEDDVGLAAAQRTARVLVV